MKKYKLIPTLGLLVVFILGCLDIRSSLYANIERAPIRAEGEPIRTMPKEDLPPEIISKREDFRKARQNITRQAEAGEISNYQAKQLISKLKAKLETDIQEIRETLRLEREKRKLLAKQKRRGELGQRDKENMLKRKNELDELKLQFEEYKKETLKKVRAGELTHLQAREVMETYRKNVIMTQKQKILKEKQDTKIKEKGRVKDLVRHKIHNKLGNIQEADEDKQQDTYSKIEYSINTKLEDDELSNNDKVLLTIIQEVIAELKNSLD